jgi:hypothetical protein
LWSCGIRLYICNQCLLSLNLSFVSLPSAARIVPFVTVPPSHPMSDPASGGAKKKRGGRGKDTVKRAAWGSKSLQSKSVGNWNSSDGAGKENKEKEKR